jgi:hypothetical protein
MTLIVGIADRRKVWLGADSASVSGEYSTIAREPKIFEREGWLVACAGDWRALDLIRYEARLPNVPPAANLHSVVCVDFSRAISTTFSDNGYELKDENDLNLLIASGNALFNWNAWHAEQVSFYAVGMGDEIALGYLEARHGTRAPAEVIRETFKVTRKYYAGAVRPPYRIAHT